MLQRLSYRLSILVFGFVLTFFETRFFGNIATAQSLPAIVATGKITSDSIPALLGMEQKFIITLKQREEGHCQLTVRILETDISIYNISMHDFVDDVIADPELAQSEGSWGECGSQLFTNSVPTSEEAWFLDPHDGTSEPTDGDKDPSLMFDVSKDRGVFKGFGLEIQFSNFRRS